MQYPNTITPLDWQKKCLEKFEQDSESLAILAEVGCGKTFAAITIIRRIQEIHGKKNILIICPSVVINNWKSELKKFSFPEDFDHIVPLDNSTKRHHTMLEMHHYKKCGVVITNYESFDSDKFVKELEKWGPVIIICDELHRIKNYKSKRAKKIVDVALSTRWRLGLTGTAVLNSPMDLFMQWKFIDLGRSFGENFFNFRRKYFYDANEQWSHKHSHFPDFKPIPHMMDEMNKLIEKKSYKVLKSECMDLPPFIETTIKLKMAKDQQEAYDSMMKNFIAYVQSQEGGKAAVANLALTKALRLMQIASGFVGLDDGSTHSFKDNPKIDALDSILDEIGEDKVIVWCSYKQNYGDLYRYLLDKKIKFTTITGEQSHTEKTDAAYKFQTDPEVRVMVANRKAGGIGINLTMAKYSVVFSRNFSLEEEIQSDGRNFRKGSEIHDRITKINLVMEDSIEEKVIGALKNKSDMAEVILDFKRDNF